MTENSLPPTSENEKEQGTGREFAVAIANELVRARQAKGWTQADLQRETGLARETIKKYEQARHVPGAREIRALCAALDISPNRLIFGTDSFEVGSIPLHQAIDPSTSAKALMLRYVILFTLLTEDERRSVTTLMESIAAHRNEQNMEAMLAVADALADPSFEPVLAALAPVLQQLVDTEKTIQKSNQEIAAHDVEAAKRKK